VGSIQNGLNDFL